MNIHTETQIITENGAPAFAVIPWAEYEQIRPQIERQRKLRNGIPNAVAKRVMLDDVSSVRAWREHLGLEQAEVAGKAGMKPPMLSRIESGQGGSTRKSTLQRIATAMGLTIEQLDI